MEVMEKEVTVQTDSDEIDQEWLEQKIKTHILFEKDIADIGVYKRKDGSRYAILIIEPTEQEILAQSSETAYQQVYRSRSKLLDYFEQELKTNPALTLKLFTRDGCVQHNKCMMDDGPGADAREYIGVFSKLRVVTKNGRRQMHAEYRQTNQNQIVMEDNRDKVSINPAYFKKYIGWGSDFEVDHFSSFFIEARTTDLESIKDIYTKSKTEKIS